MNRDSVLERFRKGPATVRPVTLTTARLRRASLWGPPGNTGSDSLA
jgi:hypothetical protein